MVEKRDLWGCEITREYKLIGIIEKANNGELEAIQTLVEIIKEMEMNG
ncbi:hypothetical protein P4G85_20755 [Bacillus cereus]|uniref:Uncharacterized protein n=1 Tax=Bacillus cereus VD154 TaxID=1053238 RepID=A0A9W5KQG7_BACCE|nr:MULTISPECIES: hypothetical protein [Bacillus cereus group]MEB8733352.1 hypothetical protein [Bacillus cereus]EEM44696.1 hypothetical protein bthur0005_54970 [Bacillus thuringiensis serovar pakistani str. T13001]EJR59497.1 hypothetical protein IK5_06280 [Bacillus cereus VD154]MEB8750738.1 hypothetical protein [Bacillus cereus]MEB8764336.1 hypothetical protein [Bacillus cereus]